MHPRAHHECLSLLLAAACQNCVPGLHRVEVCLHVVNSLIHHGSQILQQVAAAACAGCLKGCDGVLGLLGVCAGSDELLLQGSVLQVEQGKLLSDCSTRLC